MKGLVTFGELMIRLSPPEQQKFRQAVNFDIRFGGAEANVAVSLANFGLPVKYITCVPENELGKAAVQELNKFKVDTSLIQYTGKRLGLYFLEKGADLRPSRVIYDRAHSSFSEIKKGSFDWKEIFRGASWFHWTGVTPAVSQAAADVLTEAVNAAYKMKLTISADLNFRKNLWQYGKKPSTIIPGLVQMTDVVFGGPGDTETMLGIKEKAKSEDEIFRIWKKNFPKIKYAAMLRRSSVTASQNDLTGMLFDGKKIYKTPTAKVSPIIDRVGTGDAFAAGIIYGLNSFPGDLQKTLEFAVSASRLKHSISGDFNLVSASEVLEHIKGNNSKIDR